MFMAFMPKFGMARLKATRFWTAGKYQLLARLLYQRSLGHVEAQCRAESKIQVIILLLELISGK